METWIYLWSQNSNGGRKLSEALPAKRIRHVGSNFVGSPEKPVINWGCSQLPDRILKSTVFNKPEKVGLVTNKLRFFENIGNVRVPPWTTDPEIAEGWQQDGKEIVARTTLNGHGGRGIVLIGQGERIVEAPLYTCYVPKMYEYRIHCVGKEIVDIQRKAANREIPKERINWKIRNHHNGFIYVRNGFVCPEDVKVQSLAAFQKIGLDFGAVDVIWNKEKNRAYVLEINTAPGLVGSSINIYANAIRGFVNEMLHL